MQSGDVDTESGVVWSRADRASRMIVEWSAAATFAGAKRIVGPVAGPETDFTAKVKIAGLAPATRVHYRVRFEGETASDWVTGAFSTAPDARDLRDVVFAWSADTNGQGWGIDPARGGMPAYTALLERAPHFFVHCGDQIYADNPIAETSPVMHGGTWKNLVTPAKSRVAVTLEDFRGAFLYPRHSSQVRALYAAVPSFSIWDDHEVRNNWYPGSPAFDPLVPRARRAMFEHTPTLRDAGAPSYRSLRWGPHLEVFLLDGRSFRTPNEPAPAIEHFLGEAQLAWLEQALVASSATWKVIACDMPIALVVSEPGKHVKLAFDGYANEDGPPRGREHELARLLATSKSRRVSNVVWITADVHYAAAHRFDPGRAQFKDMDPFWEFVAGPLHATAFPRKPFDDTFGPELAYASAAHDTYGSPATGACHFGLVRIDGKTRAMTVTLVDARNRDLFTTTLAAS